MPWRLKGLRGWLVDERDGFRALYEEHRDGLHSYLLSRTGDREAALDLLQEVFLRAWRRRPALVQECPNIRRYWLYAVARNLSIDRYRRQAGYVWSPLPAPREISAGGPGVEQEIVAASELEIVSRALAELPASLREPLVMSTVANLSSAEIGEALGIPPGTVRYRISLARVRIARAVDPSTIEGSQC